ncbi:hypothetical protein D3C80_523490 [compost metagenome]
MPLGLDHPTHPIELGPRGHTFDVDFGLSRQLPVGRHQGIAVASRRCVLRFSGRNGFLGDSTQLVVFVCDFHLVVVEIEQRLVDQHALAQRNLLGRVARLRFALDRLTVIEADHCLQRFQHGTVVEGVIFEFSQSHGLWLAMHDDCLSLHSAVKQRIRGVRDVLERGVTHGRLHRQPRIGWQLDQLLLLGLQPIFPHLSPQCSLA